jgi:3-polyprenyl-4-hydroxybenzoate decarboxylase
MTGQDIRSFVAAYERAHPGEVVRVSDPVSIEYDVMALVLEYERRRRYPILFFDKVGDSGIPVVCNVVASRGALAFALGVPERALAAEYARRIKDHLKPVVISDPGISASRGHRRGRRSERAAHPDLLPRRCRRLLDGGHARRARSRYRRRDGGLSPLPGEGAEPDGGQPHSRRRMFEYQRRAEAKGQALPCAVVLGLHPLVSMGSLAYPPADVGKFEVVGGLFGEPLQVAACATIDLHVPAAAEIVIEGEILPGEREPEGPFGEFTGYFSRRSTEHIFVARAIAMRERPWFQSIGSGRAGDHITTLGLVREAEILNALGRVIPNVKAVHVPLSGASSFTAFVSIRQTRPGEAKHVIPIVLGVDHYLKLVVVVDDDVDVFDESDVLWAVATRMQADRDLVSIAGSLGAMLDPSADDRGITAKLGIDATRPFGLPFAEKLVMPQERMDWARALADRLATAGG